MHRNQVLGALCVTVVLLVMSSTPGGAVDVTWNDASGGNFTDGTKWDTGTPPGPGDNAIITLDGTYSVVLDTRQPEFLFVRSTSSGILVIYGGTVLFAV